MFPLLKRAEINGELQLPASAMICNFPRAQNDRPSLLYHDDVLTFIHEFTLICHTMCTTSSFNRFSGTSVEKDFVEMPSLMLENWMWDEKVITEISMHHQTK